MLGQEHIVEAARILWGAENAKLSSNKELRFGTHGSKSIKLNGDQSVWYDHETQQGGGIIDLCRLAGVTDGDGGDDPWITYDYRDEDGDLLFQVVRKPGHKFLQRRPNGYSDDWIWDLKDTRRILYRLPQLLASNDTVFIVEGEKDANNVARLGLTATTNPGGAGKWRPDYNEFLSGRTVVILPDNDDVGREHATHVRDALSSVAKSVQIVPIPHGKDVSDWLANGGSKDALLALVEQPRQPTSPLPFVHPDWDDVPVPQPEWSVQDRIPARQACLFSGHGGTGKSIIGLQLCAAHVLGRDWLYSMPTFGPTFFVDAEDHINVLHWRLEAIRQVYGVAYAELEKDLHLLPMAGEDAVLAGADKNGKIAPTPFYARLLEAASDIKPVQIVIASAADVFAGNENDRAQVRQFASLLTRLAIRTGGSVILIAHPSKSAMAENGGGYSGSTAWHNSFRARISIEGSPDNEDGDLRRLSFLKNQYGPLAETVTLRWRNGLFLPEPKAGTYEQAARDAQIEAVIIALVRKFKIQKQPISPRFMSRTYLPTVFVREPEAKGMTKAELKTVMERMIEKHTLVVRTWGPPSDPRPYIELP